MSTRIVRVDRHDSALLVVDVQEKLLALIPGAPELLINAAFLLDVAKLLEIPVLATEQYPSGLGATAPTIAERLPRPIPEKTSFSCCGAAGFDEQCARLGRSTLVIAGIESHVCIMQTALDLLDRGHRVVVPADAIASRTAVDHEWALHRLERAGATLTTAEALAFEWLGSSSAAEFKALSALVKDRSRRFARA